MDTSTRFFAKLRSLVVLFDSERTNLEHTASQNLSLEDDDAESGAVQALHELHSEVRGLKKQVQNQVASQEDGSTELRSFIKACMVLKQRSTEDIERIQRHYEKYGYKPHKASLKPETNCKGEANVGSSVEDSPEGELSEERADDDESVEAPQCETPEKMACPAVDPMRTPQLSDFGLSALHLQMVLGNSEMSQDVPPVPPLAVTPPSFIMTMHESQPKTPKCSLRMDEEALTPRLEDFGITESTMCFNNDFTMDLFCKKPPKDRQTNSTTEEIDQRPEHSLPTAPSCASHSRFSDSMESPELPVFSTLEIKMNKQLGQSCSLPKGVSDPDSPPQPSAGTTTPELPTFETPYISKLISARKETKQGEGLTGSQNSTSYSAEGPSVSVLSSEMPQMPGSLSQMEETTPEMPRLQSFFSSTLPCIGASNRSAVTEPSGPLLPADEHTQDWCLATPRIRMEFDAEPRTPEMPDMSSITQDIFKLVSQANKKPPLHQYTQAQRLV
ncbi:spindle and kinetochore-associated protein 3 [Silurus meridionalis]|uniref:Spindle and kinetochore-associated protein 3 n=1 Tax=Silurus meridionalis TaxID=175797 RepID=A0A8T0BQS2_SILME|nr:spindle and kinetochore-associated protein 3 [Silurus meridionalis]KAF7709364.1 hypothetical protein HF521_016214 [Silurus meridionalis]